MLQGLLEKILLQYKVIKLKEKMNTVKNYHDWAQFARTLDQLEGKDEWKEKNET